MRNALKVCFTKNKRYLNEISRLSFLLISRKIPKSRAHLVTVRYLTDTEAVTFRDSSPGGDGKWNPK